jgi:two-component system, OmpR family, sensor histidine kinase RstB
VEVQGDDVMGVLDAAKVERILENLLSNTTRHTDAGTRVWVRVWRETDGVMIAVEDDGPGVPEHLRADVFEPFRRGERPQAAPGVGIGLSLVARFSEMHGGRAWVEERDGGGASFRVFLPDA